MQGIHEKKILGKLKYNFDGLIMDKIVNQYLYPKKPFLDELKEICKYFKLIFLLDSQNYYTINKGYIIESLNKNINNSNTKNYFKNFQHYYMDYKECVVNVKKTFKYNEFTSIKSLKDDIGDKLYLFTYNIDDTKHLHNIIFIDSSIMINSTRSLITKMFDYYYIYKNHYLSQRDYLYILNDLELSLFLDLKENNIDGTDLSYEDKLEIFRKL
ncbi:hypothetical protein CL656_04755 [bacterium]|nr:hypothetical protein [bacterium]|tara:strand:+ start:9790 stop:10428 length:639 start_codon:yes stop_codon:yes gene_type:complete